MENQNKYYFLIASAYSPIKVAWFIGKQLQVSLYQRNIIKSNSDESDFLSVFESLDEGDTRISLYKVKDLDIKKIDKFDYLLVIVNYNVELQRLRDAKFINFITELSIENLPKGIQKSLKYL